LCWELVFADSCTLLKLFGFFFWAVSWCGAFGPALGPLGSPLGSPWVLLRPLGSLLGLPWVPLGSFFGFLGYPLGLLGSLMDPLGSPWVPLGSPLGPLGSPLGPLGCTTNAIEQHELCNVPLWPWWQPTECGKPACVVLPCGVLRRSMICQPSLHLILFYTIVGTHGVHMATNLRLRQRCEYKHWGR
jgi:hypothetical protein